MALRSLIPFDFDQGFDPFTRLHRDINRLLNDFSPGGRVLTSDQSLALIPNLDIYETDNALTIAAELPGLEEKDIHIELNNNILTIKGEKKVEREKEGQNYHLIERSSGSFQRSIQIPFPIVASDIQATFDKGVLTITLPKAPEAKSQPKRIEIRPSAKQ